MQTPNNNPNGTVKLNITTFSIDKNTSNYVNGILGLIDLTDILAFKVNNLDDFIEYNIEVTKIINSILIHDYKLNERNEKFHEAVTSGLLSKYPIEDPEDAERKELLDLLEKKNGYYELILTESIKQGSINLPGENIEDLINLMRCGILEWMNGVYRKIEFAVKNHGDKFDLGDSINYGMPSEKGPTGYQDTFDGYNIDEDMLSQINDTFLREYLYKILEFARSGNYNYVDWIKAELNEVNSWLSENKLAFIAPMENYKHKNYIDPEFLLLMREKMSKNSGDYADLSARMFGDNYGMDQVKIFLAEPVLIGGEQTYCKFMGKSFPNDMELREKYGNFIIIIKGQIHKAFDEYAPYVAKIFDIKLEEYNKNKKMIVDGAIEEVTYHEYGHSIFTTQHHNMLEEAKATLFYWTYLYEKYITNNENIDEKEVKRIIQAFTLDFTRYITRLKIPKYRKYIYTAQILLKHMLDNNLLAYAQEKNLLSIVEDGNTVESFKALIKKLHGVTNQVKNIYKSDTLDKTGEKTMTSYYDDTTLGILNNLVTKF